ncbi:MAG TPA: T9SS type A sorting domain-containing protein, partial [Flavobacteriales bacterium]|nr:T9SS type A sorting domain-containing protein [Flavobacteriales bacterium]
LAPTTLEVQVFPQPSNESFTVSAADDAMHLLTLHDSRGALVLTRRFGRSMRMDTALSPGVYFYTVRAVNGSAEARGRVMVE